MKADMPELTNLMEWNRFSDEEKTLLEALTILNNRHRQVVAELNQQLEEKHAQIVKLTGTLRFIYDECDWEACGDGGDDRIGSACKEALSSYAFKLLS